MIRRPPRSTRTDTLFPYTTLFRSMLQRAIAQTPESFARAGSAYALLPISVPGAFHPKVSIRLGSDAGRSEEHTSELQSLMRISYAVFCLKKKKTHKNTCKTRNNYRNTKTKERRTNQQYTTDT